MFSPFFHYADLLLEFVGDVSAQFRLHFVKMHLVPMDPKLCSSVDLSDTSWYISNLRMTASSWFTAASTSFGSRSSDPVEWS